MAARTAILLPCLSDCGTILAQTSMAYVPGFESDLFISYSHADDFGWIERLKSEIESALVRKLRASTFDLL